MPLLIVAGGLELLLTSRLNTKNAAQFAFPILVGVLLERIIHGVYAVSVRSHHQWWQHTPLEIDFGHLTENFAAELGVLRETMWWWLLPIAVVLSVVLLARRQTGQRVARTAIIFTALSLVNFVAVCLLSWTRINHYNPHYLAAVHLFGSLGAFAGVAALQGAPVRRWAPALGAVLLGVTLVAARSEQPDPEMQAVDRVSRELASRAPGLPLFGSYWGTYLFVDASVDRPVVPYIIEGEFTRAPWLYDGLLQSDSVIVSQYKTTRFGPVGEPVPFIQERGALLELQSPNWLRDGSINLALYRNLSQHLLAPVRVTASDTALETEGMGEGVLLPLPSGAFQIDFPPVSSGRLVVFFGPPEGPPATLPKLDVEPASPARVTVTQIPAGLVISFSADQPVGGFRFTESQQGAVPPLRSTWLLPFSGLPAPRPGSP